MRTRTPSASRRTLRRALFGASLSACAWLSTFLGGPSLARAADGGAASGASISPEYYAPRFVAGTDTTAPSHLNNFSPLAINYADCVNEIDIQFSLDLTAAPANDEIQVWAGTGTADCTQVSARTYTSVSDPTSFPGRCWPVAGVGAFDPTQSTSTARLHVLDLVSHIGDDLPPTTYTQTLSTSVCQPHATTGAVPLNIYFMFVTSGSGRGGVAPVAPDGVPGLYSTPAALVGPFAPTSVVVPNSGITATTLTVNWVPQSDGTIQGFNIYAEDQGPEGDHGTKPSADSGAVQIQGVECHPAKPCVADAGATNDAGNHDTKDASHDASDAGVRDATLADDAHDDKDAGGGSASASSAEESSEGASASSSAPTCDAGLEDAWAAEDASAFAGIADAALAALGCRTTGPLNAVVVDGGGTNLTCTSAILVNTFTVDGGLGSVATAASDSGTTSTLTTVTSPSDAGADADAGGDSGAIALAGSTAATNVPEVAGISNVPASHLVYYSSGATTNSYQLTGLVTGDQYAVGVAAVDSYGNVGPLGMAIGQQTGLSTGAIVSCSTPTPVDDFFTLYGLDGGTAGGGFCALTAPGAPAPFAASVAAFAGAAILRARRRRRRRNAS